MSDQIGRSSIELIAIGFIAALLVAMAIPFLSNERLEEHQQTILPASPQIHHSSK